MLLLRDKSDHELAQIIWDYMRYEQPLEKAGLIFVLGSDDIRVAERARELYAAGYAPHIIISGDSGSSGKFYEKSEAEMIADYLIENDVDEHDIILEPKARNTGQNITLGYEILKSHGLLPVKSMILVQKPFMLRRTYATFMKQWPENKKPRVMTTALGISFEEYTKDPHYDFLHTVNTMVGDLQRIREYPKFGFQIEQEIPADVWSAFEELVRRGYDKHLISQG